jgi:general secretion pathway protein E
MELNLNVINQKKEKRKVKKSSKELSSVDNSLKNQEHDIIKSCIEDINKKPKYANSEKKNLNMPYNEFIRYSENMEELAKKLGLDFFDFPKEIPSKYLIVNTDDKYLIENNLFVLEDMDTKQKFLLVYDFKSLNLNHLVHAEVKDFAIASLHTMNLLLAQNNEIKATVDSEKGANDYMSELFTFAKVNKISDIVMSLKEFQLSVKLLSSNGWKIVSILDRKQAEIIRNYLEVKSNVESGSKIFDSKITFNDDEMRINFFITAHGYRATIRVFNNDFKHFNSLKDIGYTEDVEKIITEISLSKNGMIIISAPTGNGKTTTQNIILGTLAKSGAEIVSIEHPVEQSIKLIDQVDTSMYVTADEENKVTSKTMLKNFLRAKPDIINGGEVRDEEDYNMAIEIALTGHLFFGSTHSISVKTTIARMVKNGIQEEDIKSLLRGVVCQTLVKKLCNHCKIPDGKGGFKTSQKGCKFCKYGYENKKTPIVEVAKFSPFKDWKPFDSRTYDRYISLENNANLKYKEGTIDAIHRDALVKGEKEPFIYEIVEEKYLADEDKNIFLRKFS